MTVRCSSLWLALAAVTAPCAAVADAVSAANAVNAGVPTIQVRHPPAQLGADLVRAAGAYNAGDLASARQIYESVLAQQGHNVNALNGLATIAQRQGKPALAETYLQRALESDPGDAWAQSALLNLKAQADPYAESRLKALAQAKPGLFYTHFALGNLYAAQGRWSDAARAYQRAAASDANNPDALFNLAVSLEHQRQPGRAASYYRRTQEALATRPSASDAEVIAQRLRLLEAARP